MTQPEQITRRENYEDIDYDPTKIEDYKPIESNS
jgi:hypothetical protein